MPASPTAPVRLMLWAHPRSRSTALERAFIERGDCTVLHEPFSKVRYHDADTAPLLAAVADPALLETSALLDDVRYAPVGARHAVVKDMPSHAEYDDAFLASFTHHLFLVRDPADSIRSYYAVDPGFQEEEAGYAEMLELAGRLRASEAKVAVVESDVFAEAPEKVLRVVCEFLELEWLERMVRWEAREEMPNWNMWSKFHKTALKSTTIEGGKEGKEGKKKKELPAEKERLVERLTPVYESILVLMKDSAATAMVAVEGGA